MRKIKLDSVTKHTPQIFRVLSLDNLDIEWLPNQSILVPVTSVQEVEIFDRYIQAGLDNLYSIYSSDLLDKVGANNLFISEQQVLKSNDVVTIDPYKKNLSVLLRASDTHHTLFLTNRCNNYCIMCSQPPTKHDDSWLIQQALEIIDHLSYEPMNIGLTGGEPLLLDEQLRLIIDTIHNKFPSTEIDVLTNGRLFSNPKIAESVLSNLETKVNWLVPLYGHADLLHDFVVQQHSAFEETLEGLYILQHYEQPIQLRIVLVKPVLENLIDLCAYIRTNLPFVKEVALIGCEPIGFALANKELSQVDIKDWWDQLNAAVDLLLSTKTRLILMNIPLCCLPQSLWQYAAKSISDWKNTYDKVCESCDLKKKCCGLFTWYQNGWTPSILNPIKLVDNPC
ncbi:His-Xaa-Ser system radical SAM maturase HxsC [Acinetobacter bereziniae]|jgi:His-Xaa-Ser system radical SAM maturase HxsC|uniref:His-Xaa-Ser system radical SAM maturase HxsC n=1 Tax=Acinetobacter bereziniae TaxID=106648 RepID=UPI0021CEF6E0|nr:His-Xaa-Ser system radical SAM maturase HxsC [Acinetobacter bereziniae]MCU4313589.1 His-Xaa-Ser system radical SAM maturase HxsC [Acinetobacter bereziniae]